jgi:hypothetical protein
MRRRLPATNFPCQEPWALRRRDPLLPPCRLQRWQKCSLRLGPCRSTPAREGGPCLLPWAWGRPAHPDRAPQAAVGCPRLPRGRCTPSCPRRVCPLAYPFGRRPRLPSVGRPLYSRPPPCRAIAHIGGTTHGLGGWFRNRRCTATRPRADAKLRTGGLRHQVALRAGSSRGWQRHRRTATRRTAALLERRWRRHYLPRRSRLCRRRRGDACRRTAPSGAR